jgi:two-component system sensor histidine kinase AlgZ
MPSRRVTPLVDRRRQPRGGDSWLPEFCTLPVALATMVVAELVLLFIALAPSRGGPANAATLTLGSVFVQWLCVCNLALLCSARARLARMPTPVATALALICVTAVSAAASAVAYWLDDLLALHAVPPHVGQLWFAASISGMALIAAGAALRYHYVAHQWRTGVAAQAQAQFDALQARIRPHFLFNSMNTIASLIRSRPQDAERAVEDLSDLFRATLRSDDRSNTLADELELVRRYLSIEALRIGPRMRTRIEDHDVPDIAVPALILQPLVENAVLHGIQAIEGAGEVSLVVGREGGRVTVEIGNPRPRHPQPSRGTGTALDNVRRRLHYRYEGRAGLELHEGPDYYRVKISLPTT